ncbi:MAG: CmcJ/NvfI family oxidoreductase [Gammaproteobacteria bacterium]
MSNPSPTIPVDENRLGVFNYLAESTEASLYRNGKVLTKRDADGSDAGLIGVDRIPRSIEVRDARTLGAGEKMTCEANGFELLSRPLEDDTLDFLDHQAVVKKYYKQCEKIVAESTGAEAFAFDHNIRSAAGKNSKKRISGGQQVQGPAHIIHGDYTLYSGPQRLRDLAKPPSGNDTLASLLPAGQALISQEMVERALGDGGRFAIINVWRSIADEPVQTDPLALCDGRTVEPEDLVVFEIHYQDRIGENYFAKPSARHKFYFYPEMTRDEAMLIKQWDSAGPLAMSNGAQADGSVDNAPCTFSFHSAFEDLTVADDAPDRWSIEVRCIVIY